LAELRDKLKAAPERFTVEALQQAHDLHYRKALVDIISMVKHAADEQSPLLTAAERVERAFARVGAGRAFTLAQQWLERSWQHLIANLSVGRGDFDEIPILHDAGAGEAPTGRLRVSWMPSSRRAMRRWLRRIPRGRRGQ